MTGRWQSRAACRGEDPELFFPDEWDKPGIAAAKAVCAHCPVADACLAAAVEFGDEHGVRGGVSAEERRDAQVDGFMLIGFPEPAHGRSLYVEQGCRCEVCTEANRVYVADRRSAGPPVTARPKVGREQIGLEVAS